MKARKSEPKTKPILAVMAAVFIAAFLVYYFYGTSTVQASKVKIGYLSFTACIPVFVGLEKGYFAEEGLDVELVNIQNSNQVAEATASGQVDFGTASTSVVFNIEQRSPGSLMIIGDFVTSSDRPFNSIIVRNDSDLTVDQLRGKKIAIFPGSTALALTKIAMRDLVGDDFTAEYDQILPNLWLQSLSAGKVDAVLSYEPFTTSGIKSGAAKVLYPAIFEKHVMDDFPQGSFIVPYKMVKEKPETVEKMKRAIAKSIAFVRENELEAKLISTKYLPISEDVAREMELQKWNVAEGMNINNIQKYADILFEQGELQQRIDVSKMVFVRQQ